MSARKQVKVAIISGYLGAGKTTLLNKILGNVEGIKAAVIVNDIGEVNIDADLIAQTGSMTQVDDLIPMTNGCICCSLSEDLANQLLEIAETGSFDYVIIEASGVCEPMPIAYTVMNLVEPDEDGWVPMVIDNVISVVDCARMFDEFNGGQDLMDEDLEEDDLENLIIQQIEFCSTLILNKSDLVTRDQLDELRAIVRSLQKSAKIIEATHGDVPLSDLLNTGLYDFDRIFDSATWVDAMDHTEDYEEPAHDHEHHHHHDHDHDHDGECACGDHDHDHEHHHHHHDDDCDSHHGGHCNCGHDHEDGHDHLAEYGITTFVYQRRRSITEHKLAQFVHEWPEGVVRCKGMVWVSDDEDQCYLFEQAGKQFYLSANGPWLATADDEEREWVIKNNPRALEDWDDAIGDRRIKLVFIGRHMDRAAVEAQLDALLD